MTGSMEVRMQAIRRRTVQKRRTLDRRAFACLSAFSLCLIAGIAAPLLRSRILSKFSRYIVLNAIF